MKTIKKSPYDIVSVCVPPKEKTIRDEFAMAALTGLIAKDTKSRVFREDKREIIQLAYEYADEAIRVRKQ